MAGARPNNLPIGGVSSVRGPPEVVEGPEGSTAGCSTLKSERRRGRPRYPYNAGSAGVKVVEGPGPELGIVT